MATQCSRGLYFLLTSAHCYAAKAARAPQLSTGKLFLQGCVSVLKRCDSTGILFFCSASGVVPRVGGTDQPADPSIWRYAAISEGQAFHYQFCYLLTCRNQCIANAVLAQHLQILNSIQLRPHPCHRRQQRRPNHRRQCHARLSVSRSSACLSFHRCHRHCCAFE